MAILPSLALSSLHEQSLSTPLPSLYATMGHGGGGDRGEQMEAGRTSTLEHSIVPGSPTDRRRTSHTSR